MKKILLIVLIVFLFSKNSYSANSIGISSDIVFFPISKNESITFFYGVKGFSDIYQSIRIDYSLYFNNSSGLIFSTPITISYILDGNYKFNIRPQLFAGINPFFSNMENFSGIKFYTIIGFGLDYVFENNHVFNISSKLYINDSFFKQKIDNYAFNTGIAGLNLTYSIQY